MNCKNNHIYKNISIKDFIISQKIDISKIRCNICNEKDKSSIYNNIMYKCISCNKKICPICNINHNKALLKIDYDNLNYICNKHNEIYIKYCNECKKDICMKCNKEHKNHEKINQDDILPYEYDENNFNKYIDKLKNEINEIIIKLNEIMENIELYKNKSNDIIKQNKKKIMIY